MDIHRLELLLNMAEHNWKLEIRSEMPGRIPSRLSYGSKLQILKFKIEPT